MSPARALTALAALALLGAAVWVVLAPGQNERFDPGAVSGSGGASPRATEGEPSHQEETPGERQEARVEAGAEEGSGATALSAYAGELGIPAFTGTLLRPDGRPAADAQVLALGFPGRIRGYDPQDTRRRPSVSRALRTDARGRFAIPESPNEGLRWILRFELGSLPTLEVADLGATPGRTRELGALRLQEGSVVRGVVLSEDGQPIVAAQVQALSATHGPRLSKWLETDLFPLPDATTQTRSDGSFELSSLPAGALRVAAEAPGFVRDYSAAAELQEGSRQEQIEIVLQPSRPLRGHVIGPDGARLAGTRVEARWSPIGEARSVTDAAGSFQLDLPEEASEIMLRASAEGWAVLRRRVSSKERDQELSLQLAPVGALFGRVLDENEAPLAGAQIALFPQAQHRLARVAPELLDPLARTESDAEGVFQLAFDPGTTNESRYRVIAWTESHQPSSSRTLQFAQRGDQAPAALAEEIVLQLEPGFQVTGTVSTADGLPAAGARVHLRRDGSARGTDGLSAGLAAASGDLVAAVTASERGSFVFQGVAPGDYHLEAMLAGHSPDRGANFSIVDRHWQEDLRLLHGCGIRGSVRGDRSGLARLQLIAISEEGRAYPTLVDPDGIFELPDLPPGAYEVDLFSDVGGGWSGAGRRQGPRLAEQQEVQLLEGQWTDLLFELELTELAEVSGTVLVDGRPAPDYRVFLVPAGHEGSESERERQYVVDNMRSTATDRAGSYRFVGLAELEYWVVLAPPQSAAVGAIGGVTRDEGPVGLARARIALEAGQRTRHDFALQTARLRGSIVGLRGNKEVPLRSGVATLIPAEDAPGLRRFRVSIDRDGRYAFPPLPAGNWQLDLRSGEARLRSEAFLLAPGAEEVRRDRLRLRESKR